jgi:glycerol-1-phosphate dehydrogenase [NAD(P)+]
MQNSQVFLSGQVDQQIAAYCHAHGFQHLLLLADERTYSAWGKKVKQLLQAAALDVQPVILAGDVVPDEQRIVEILLSMDATARTFLAVGAGTITDLARFVSCKVHQPFLSLPTAPSVDGFTSPVAALVIRNDKLTTPAQPPLAVFADPQILAAAPRQMIAAGFGDLLGKFTSLADWQLGHLLWHERYDQQIADEVAQLLHACVENREEIGQVEAGGVTTLMHALIASGNAMLAFGSSHPASGSEHHLSHYLELKLLRDGKPAVLHGAKVGLCMLTIAGLYEQLRRISKAEATRLLEKTRLPDVQQEIETIRLAYPQSADAVIAGQQSFLEISPADFAALKQAVVTSWDEIQQIAASVPPVDELHSLLQLAGCATTPQALGLTPEDIQEALRYGHYLRPRFTICKLMKLLFPAAI